MARRRLREGVETGEDQPLEEAGRVLSAKNLSLVRQIGDTAAELVAAAEKLTSEEDDLEETVLEEDLSQDQRMKLAKSGKAKPDGSYPIRNKTDLSNAIQSWGRGGATESDKAWIVKRAKALKATDMLPADWDGSTKVAEAVGEPVDDSWEEVRESSQVVEAVKGEAVGREFDVMIIEVGLSQNGTYYPAETLKKAVPLFEGADSFADHITKDEQQNRPERSIRDKVGKFTNPEFGSFKMGGKVREGIKARFHVVAPWLREVLKESVEGGINDFLGFSIEGEGRVFLRTVAGQRVQYVDEIHKIRSVDCVTSPAAGGRIMQLVASDRGKGVDMDPEELAKLIASQVQTALDSALAGLAAKAAELEESDDEEEEGEGEEEEEEGDEAAAAGVGAEIVAALEAKADEATAKIAAIEEALRVAQGRARLTEALSEAPVSEPSKADIRERFDDLLTRRDFDDKELTAAIAKAQDYEAKVLDHLGGSSRLAEGAVPGLIAGLSSRVRDMQMSKDYYDLAIQGMFDSADLDGPDGKKVRHFRSVKEAYCAWTGENPFELNPYAIMRAFGCQYDSALDHQRIREVIGTADWGEIFADNLYVKLQKEYVAELAYDDWRMFVSEVEDVPDFQTRHWARVGGYGDLATVAEKGTYPDLTDPTDEEVTYVIAKRGGLDDVTFEAIVGDRLNTVRRIPQGMARSAARTLYKFVMNLITTDNANTDYDTTTLYHANHNNTNAVSLTLANTASQIRAMRDQTAYNEANEILGPRNYPKFMIVPNELEQRAKRIVDPSDTYHIAPTADTDTSVDPQAFKGKGIEVKVYDVLTDADDWFLVADPSKVNTMVMGFLNGQEQPEMFIQNDPTTGSVFTSDKITYKVRHIYGGDILDHRSFMRATQ